MTEVALPTPGEFGNRVRRLDMMVALPSLAIIGGYLALLVDAPAVAWRGFGIAVGVYGLAAGVIIEWGRHRRLASVRAYLEAHLAGSKPSRETCREAFAASVGLPRTFMWMMVVIWLGAPPALLVLLWILGHVSWSLGGAGAELIVAGALGAMISAGFVFFGAKRLLAPVRLSLAAEIADPLERASLVKTTPLPRKVHAVVLGAVLGTSVLCVTLARSQGERMLDEQSVSWQARTLAALEAQMLRDGTSFDEALRSLVPAAEVLPHPASFFAVRPDELSGEGTVLAPAMSRAVEAALGEGRIAGHWSQDGGEGIVVWRAVPDGPVLVSVLRQSGRTAAVSGFYVSLMLAMLLTGGAALGVAHMMADDFKRSTVFLVEEAERMARGDLSRGRPWEAEDEMGGLGRAFERMGGALRATVGRVAEAADRVDAAASEIARVSQSVAVASADQVRRIQQANELMVQIKEQVAGVSNSAQALNVSVEESSSSILELGAAGDELNDTASVLSGKVDEVSGSIEQMVRSVKQVSSTTEGLAEAAAETSSSMEEMASAMRAVDTTAAATAGLSNEVVDLAEGGQQKVSQTIEGMEAIREATEAAERVIRGLGARANEIGGILDVIDDVADETNLLALNAAIIAAQAGEHGRSFSVVADEIKELADRVLASTKEIGSLIRAVQEESDNAVGAIEAGAKSVAEGVERSAEAGMSLEEITRAARESGTRIGEIVSAVREQTKATGHVVGLMEGVRDGVQQISTAGSEQDRGNEVVYRSSVTMREVAQQVRRTTEEQSRGFGRIRESVEGVREAVETINSSLQDQSSACSQVAAFLEQVFEGTRSNEEAAQRMGESMRDLVAQAQALRDDVAKFQI